MLLLHQSGDVHVGEVVRYTLTYTPSLDKILPPPTHLHVKIKNTSAIPLRAAYLHGPYTLYVSACPSTFDPNVKFTDAESQGEPSYEPQLKAGGSWSTKLKVPEDVRDDAENHGQTGRGERKTFTWIIEVASQVLFSKSALVHFELLVGRDEKSVHSGFTGSIQVGSGHGVPGKLEDLKKKHPHTRATEQTKGVFSKAIKLSIEDTESLWNTPEFPSWDVNRGGPATQAIGSGKENHEPSQAESTEKRNDSKRKKVHLVILTHGLHSNLGADMLYMKESIDQAAKQAKLDARKRRDELRAEKVKEANAFGRAAANLKSNSAPDVAFSSSQNKLDEADESDEEEEVIVRGFNGNAIKTERGIQYLGKRLAKYVLSITYPDQPYLPVKSSISKTITRSFTNQKMDEDPDRKPIHKHSSIVKDDKNLDHDLAYQIVSISFIGHSLGGLIQTYAIAYIQKHSPEFFDRIAPINFIALATPFLGLSNENPMYVKFALDFGLVGRTGQDLGLTWRAPTIARSGWGAMVNGLVNDPHKDKEPDPGSKPLLRILPTGPAHNALKKFRNRTVYSNVVNDGIVPLRTSCLLFLDWRGLERVEKARRDNGLVGTMVNWGWNEVTGQNVSTARKPITWNDLFSDSGDNSSDTAEDPGSTVPQADASQDLDYDRRVGHAGGGSSNKRPYSNGSSNMSYTKEDAAQQEANAWTAFLSYFKPQAGSKPSKETTKPPKIYRRAQTMKFDDNDTGSGGSGTPEKTSPPLTPPMSRKAPVRGSSFYTNNSDGTENLEAPPKTSVFEAAGDLLNPPLPLKDFLLDPAARPRTIFHDRVYHPDDIPAPPARRQRTFMRLSGSRSGSQDLSTTNLDQPDGDKSPVSRVDSSEPGGMKIEEKIARAYHKDMSWRKVLVRLEPDAHNNLIVRRMFANAYGWPVVKHLVDTHFGFTASATTRDDHETTQERAKAAEEAVGDHGEQVQGQSKPPRDGLLQVSTTDEPRRHSADGRAQVENDPINKEWLIRDATKSPINKVKEQDANFSRVRSPSEVRESRDEVSDLITMVTAQGERSSSYNTLHSAAASPHSATASLQRLQRKDSGRWSDRFFEGTDDDDSEDEDNYYAREFMKAKERGEIVPFYDNEPAEVEDAYDAKSSSVNSNILVHDGKPIVQEPGKMSQKESLLSAAGPIHELDPHTLNLSGVGLGSNATGQAATNKADQEQRSSTGIVEQVAVAQGQNNGQE